MKKDKHEKLVKAELAVNSKIPLIFTKGRKEWILYRFQQLSLHRDEIEPQNLEESLISLHVVPLGFSFTEVP